MKTALLSALALAAVFTLPAAATPVFAPVLQDHMVLQRGEPVTLWGTADEGSVVTVEWKGHKVDTVAANGQWRVSLPAQPADAEGCSIRATDGSGTATLSNILVGDVWVASGQSNMEWRIRQTAPVPADINTNNPQVRLLLGSTRLFTPSERYSEELYTAAQAGRDYEWSWHVCSPESIRNISAVGTYFALRLQETQRVSIGIICHARGGSPMESWIPTEVINSKPAYEGMRGDKWLSSPELEKWVIWRATTDLKPVTARGGSNLQHPFTPGYLHRNAVEPIAPLAVKGVIWYQGESNADYPNIAANCDKISDVAAMWRKTFRKKQLPFLMVQLPRINTEKQRPHWAEFREAQAEAARRLPGVGLICTIDLGSTNSDVHPRLKVPVGHRLADLARAQVYGETGLPSYPQVTGWQVEGNSLCIRFDRELATTDGKAPRGFVVGDPAMGIPLTAAEATLSGNCVTLALPVPWVEGMLWRYIHKTYAEPNLVGAEGGLPAFPARSESAPRG